MYNSSILYLYMSNIINYNVHVICLYRNFKRVRILMFYFESIRLGSTTLENMFSLHPTS